MSSGRQLHTGAPRALERWQSVETEESITLTQRLYRLWLSAEAIDETSPFNQWAHLFVILDQLSGTDLAAQGLRPRIHSGLRVSRILNQGS
jgi:hypothetical protein